MAVNDPGSKLRYCQIVIYITEHREKVKSFFLETRAQARFQQGGLKARQGGQDDG